MQTVPHKTDAIIEWVERVSQIPVDGSGKIPEICIVEVRRLNCFYRFPISDHISSQSPFVITSISDSFSFSILTTKRPSQKTQTHWVKN